MDNRKRTQHDHADNGDEPYFRPARHVVGHDDSNDATERRPYDIAYSRT